MKGALVIGASCGIGRQIAITLARNGFQVGVAAKSEQTTEKLPGSIYTVTDEILASGGNALPLRCDVRDDKQIEDAVSRCKKEFGQLDFVVYNAGAILWKKVVDTPLKRYDLMNAVNPRGAYSLVQSVLPYFLERRYGRILLISPPIYSRFFKGKTPYAMGKIGMTVLVHGLANELQNTGVSISALWPATVIESHVTVVKKAPPQFMRKASIFADACLRIGLEQSEKLNGQALIDEDYLRSEGVMDFTQYRCDPETEPPRMMPQKFPSLKVEEENESLDVFSKL